MQNNLEVKLIDPGHDDVHKALGFSDERTRELTNLIGSTLMETILKQKQIPEILEALSKQSKHPNELAFLCFSVGRVISEANHNPKILIGAALASNCSYEDIEKAMRS